MLYRNYGNRLAHAIDDRRNGRDPLFSLLPLLTPLPIDWRGARKPIGERPVEYLCQLGTYGQARPRLEGFVSVTHYNHPGLLRSRVVVRQGIDGCRQFTRLLDRHQGCLHTLLRFGVRAGCALGLGLRHRVDEENPYTREVEEFGTNDLFEQPG